MTEEHKQISLQISGNRLPVMVIVSMLATLAASVVYATIWLTKIDDREHINSEKISAITTSIEKLTDVVQAQQVVDERVLTLITHMRDDDVRLRNRLDKQDEWNRHSTKRTDKLEHE